MSWFTTFRRRRLYNDLAEEMREHLEEKTEQFVREGMSREEAARAARRAFGNTTLIEERSREAWQWPRLESLIADAKFALRQLRRSPGFAVTAILTLALGIGANTAIFGIVSAVLLRPLPYVHPDKLIATSVYYPKGPLAMMQARSRTMDLAGYTDNEDFNLTGSGTPVRLTGNEVSANLFSLLGCKAALGRTFHKGENEPGADQQVILSHALWQQRFGSDPAIVGRSITLEGLNRQVVGILPASFDFPSPKTQLWIPLRMDPRAIGDYWGSSYMALLTLA
jgi:putative ABC transport system permease protein